MTCSPPKSISISFSIGGDKRGTDEDDHSVALFSSDDGMGLVRLASAYMDELRDHAKLSCSSDTPLERLEPQTVMVDFIRHITVPFKRIGWNYSLYPSTMYGPETDLGHYVLHTGGDDIEHYLGSPWPKIIKACDI